MSPRGKSEQTSITLPRERLERMKSAAKEAGRSFSNYLSQLAEKHFAEVEKVCPSCKRPLTEECALPA